MTLPAPAMRSIAGAGNVGEAGVGVSAATDLAAPNPSRPLAAYFYRLLCAVCFFEPNEEKFPLKIYDISYDREVDKNMLPIKGSLLISKVHKRPSRHLTDFIL
jgi:hypothetical protein